MKRNKLVWLLIMVLILSLWGCGSGSGKMVTVVVDQTYTDLKNQEDCDALAAEKGYESVTLDEEGKKVTYVMTEAQHKELISETANKIDLLLKNLEESEEYSFESITASNEYADYVAVLNADEMDFSHQMTTLVLYVCAEMYRQYTCRDLVQLTITYKDTAGNVLYEYSQELKNSTTEQPSEEDKEKAEEQAEEVGQQEDTKPAEETTSAEETSESQIQGGEKEAETADLSAYHQILAESDQYKVELTGIDLNGMMGYSWNVHLENNTDKTLMYTAEEVSMEGAMCDAIFAEEVAPGKMANATVYWLGAEMSNLGITDPTAIEMKIKIYDSDDWMADPLCYQTVRVTPHGEEAAVTKYFNHKNDIKVVDNDSIGVYVLGINPDALMGYSVFLGIENRTDKTLNFSSDNVSVNGYMCDPYWTETVTGGKIAVSEMTWMSTVLESAGIKSVDSVEMDLMAYEGYDFMSPVFKDTISFSLDHFKQ